MGPTASGKTEVAMRLVDHFDARFPMEIVSVDSAMVYRHMNIGTAKPNATLLEEYPHRLIDICEPEDSYSAGTFVRDALRCIESIHSGGKVPLFVGGTMMYFKSLLHGIAELPEADAEIRQAIDSDAKEHGWPALHVELAKVDRTAAAKINQNDAQRIQRALEVYRLSGKSLTEWQQDSVATDCRYRYLSFALLPTPRATLHARIEKRLQEMIDEGFLDEVARLMARPTLTAEHASMRAVGYRQFRAHLAGELTLGEAHEKALAATRQLAKRQITWLRGQPPEVTVNPLEVDAISSISGLVERELSGSM